MFTGNNLITFLILIAHNKNISSYKTLFSCKMVHTKLLHMLSFKRIKTIACKKYFNNYSNFKHSRWLQLFKENTLKISSQAGLETGFMSWLMKFSSLPIATSLSAGVVLVFPLRQLLEMIQFGSDENVHLWKTSPITSPVQPLRVSPPAVIPVPSTSLYWDSLTWPAQAAPRMLSGRSTSMAEFLQEIRYGKS